ncbi:MAG: glycosyltransferase family 4 protein [Bacteroidota bacterium]|nr:glycosyltransferase family 4 protein [Bacteroidota bacterium]
MNVFPWGGSEELWYQTAKLAIKKGHSVITLTQHWNNLSDKVFELQSLGAECCFYFKPAYSLSHRVMIKLKLKKYREEVVPFIDADVFIISNGTTFNFLNNHSVMSMVIKSGKPYILISQHGFENGSLIIPNQRTYSIDLIQNAYKMFFVSERNLKSAERQLAYPISNAQHIHNPNNLKTIAIKKFPKSPALLMACVARLDCNFKGQDILLAALSSEKWKNRNYKLRLYGKGPDHQHLVHLMEMYGLQERISIEGHITNIDKIWEDNQVLVLPSISEGTPLAMVEAMLSGRAVLTTDVGDNAKYVISGKTGFLAAAATEICLLDCLEELWVSKEKLQLMGENAFQHAMEITDLHPEETLLSFIDKSFDQ